MAEAMVGSKSAALSANWLGESGMQAGERFLVTAFMG